MTKRKSAALLAVMAAIGFGGAASAATTNFMAELNPLSDSGVSGTAELTLDSDANTLTVSIKAMGLAPDMVHIQHIHGTFDDDGMPTDSVTPSFEAGADTDMDGVIELGEGVPFYGPIVLSLTDLDADPGDDGLGGFPTAPGGMIDFTETYDLASMDLPFSGDSTAEDLFPLEFREIVLHGGFLGNEGAGTDGEANGVAEYKLVLPVAAGEIERVAPVPLPAAGLLALGGIGILGGLRLSARRKTAA